MDTREIHLLERLVEAFERLVELIEATAEDDDTPEAPIPQC